MAQVKFYSVSTAPTSQTANEGGVYFVNGGELYKGSTRFGLGRVTVDANFVPSTSTLDGQARGDIVVTGGGDGWVFDGSSWQSIGGNIAAITSSWRADISSYIAGLSTGGSTSVITTITQSTDGTVSATAVSMPFATLYDVAEGWQSLNDLVGSISSSVSNLESRVAGIEGIVNATTSTVTANAITATNLSATNFSLGGGMTTVSEIVTSIGPATGEGAATDAQLPTALGVRNAITAAVSNLAGAMHFKGTATITKTGTSITVTNFSETFTPAAGDVVVDTTNNLEAVYTGSAWELLGNNSVFALDAYTSTASVYTGVSTVHGALNAAGAAIDTLTASASTFASQKAQIGSSTTDNFYGMTATIELNSNANPTIVFTNGVAGSDIVTTSTAIAANANRLVTANAVYDFATNLISNAGWNSTSSSASNAVAVTVAVDTSTSSSKLLVGVEVSAATTAADVSDANKASYLVTAGAVSAYTVQEITSAISGLDAAVFNSDKGVFVSVAEEDGKLNGMTVTVTAAAQMGFDAHGSADELATTAAIRDFYDNNLVWLDASGTAITTA